MALAEGLGGDRVDLMMDEIDILDRDVAKELAYRIRRIAHAVENRMRRELSEMGIELWELEILAALIRSSGGSLTAGDLVDQTQLTSGGVTHRLNKMEARGWIERSIGTTDRRRISVSLTAEGEKRAREVFSAKTTAERETLGQLPDAELRGINASLRRLLLAVEGPCAPIDSGA